MFCCQLLCVSVLILKRLRVSFSSVDFLVTRNACHMYITMIARCRQNDHHNVYGMTYVTVIYRLNSFHGIFLFVLLLLLWANERVVIFFCIQWARTISLSQTGQLNANVTLFPFFFFHSGACLSKGQTMQCFFMR